MIPHNKNSAVKTEKKETSGVCQISEGTKKATRARVHHGKKRKEQKEKSRRRKIERRKMRKKKGGR